MHIHNVFHMSQLKPYLYSPFPVSARFCFSLSHSADVLSALMVLHCGFPPLYNSHHPYQITHYLRWRLRCGLPYCTLLILVSVAAAVILFLASFVIFLNL